MITGMYAALCGLLLIVLYLRVSQRRLATKIGIGSGGDAILEQRIRAHGNFIESVPITLILLYLFEQSGVAALYVHTFGVLLVVARIGHAQGLSSTGGRSAGRFYGSIGTVAIVSALSIWLLIRSI